MYIRIYIYMSFYLINLSNHISISFMNIKHSQKYNKNEMDIFVISCSFLNGSAIKALPPPRSLMAVVNFSKIFKWQKNTKKYKKYNFFLMARPLPPPLNGAAIKIFFAASLAKREYFFCVVPCNCCNWKSTIALFLF